MKNKIREILQQYRIGADFLYSEVTDGAHTQKEYEKALKRLEDNCVERIKCIKQICKRN